MNLKEAQNLVKYHEELVNRKLMLEMALDYLERGGQISIGSIQIEESDPDYCILYEANQEVLIKRIDIIHKEIKQLEEKDA